MRSRSSTTPHLPSYFLPITSIQLFHHQSYRHTFPIPNEPSKSEVHQIPSHPVMICIELPHFFSLLQCSMVSPSISILSRMLRYYRRSALPLGLSKNLLLILVLSLILFRHFQKFSKLLNSLSLHLPSIQRFTIGLQPIKHIMLLYPMLGWIPVVLLQEPHHFIVSH